MNKKTKWGLAIFIVCCLVVWGIYSQMPKQNEELQTADKVAQSKSKERKVLNVNGMRIKTGNLSDEIQIPGILLPDEEVDLSFETSGKIVEINFQEGSYVTKGQLLAKVNDRQLQAELRRLTAQLKLANDRVDRQKRLLQRDAVSQEAYEQVRTSLETLKAEIEIVKAQIELTELRAPFDGVIGLRQISVGAYASPTTIVSKLTRVVPLKVEFSVPERYSDEVNPGTSLIFNIDGSLKSFPAKVYAKESAIDANSHSMTVRAIYANTGGTLMPGRYISVVLKKQEITDAIAIPAEAIIPEMGKDKVFLYRSGKAQPVEIKTGLRTDAVVQVLSGLQVGDTLITSGTLQLRTDLPVVLDHVEL